MKNDWNSKELGIHLQKIINHDEIAAVTLSPEMLDYLKVVVGEDVQVEMTEHKLVIRKIMPFESTAGLSEHYCHPLNETPVTYEATESKLEESKTN